MSKENIKLHNIFSFTKEMSMACKQISVSLSQPESTDSFESAESFGWVCKQSGLTSLLQCHQTIIF